MASDRPQYVDQNVTHVKFRHEVQEFENQRDDYRKKGVIFIEKKAFTISFLFAIPHIRPQAIPFGIQLDYRNWDVEPPSLKFIDPFNGNPLKKEEIPIEFIQARDPRNPFIINGRIQELDLLQGNQHYPPFLCIPGIKEYHDHFAHSGDSWMAHRTRGEGKLITLLEQIWKHSVAQAGGYNVEANINFRVGGIQTNPQKLS